MRRQLLIPLLLLLAATRIAKAQCNPKEYARIFSEAQALQERGQFIEAKNTYEAAKIFACSQKAPAEPGAPIQKGLYVLCNILTYNP